jgi:hypothetical protein
MRRVARDRHRRGDGVDQLVDAAAGSLAVNAVEHELGGPITWSPRQRFIAIASAPNSACLRSRMTARKIRGVMR